MCITSISPVRQRFQIVTKGQRTLIIYDIDNFSTCFAACLVLFLISIQLKCNEHIIHAQIHTDGSY